jgi:hypothetical protein
MKRLGVALLIALALSATAFALEDTQENRSKQAERYLEVSPLSDMLKDAAEQVSMNFPPDQRENFKALLTQHLDIDSLTQSVKEIMVKHFTAEELKAMADFYGSRVGKSAMKKFGAYMADAMPIIQAEMVKAQTKAYRELKSTPE